MGWSEGPIANKPPTTQNDDTNSQSNIEEKKKKKNKSNNVNFDYIISQSIRIDLVLMGINETIERSINTTQGVRVPRIIIHI